MAIAADAPPPSFTAGAGVGAGCALEASIHLRNKPVMFCWSSRAAGDVKVSV
jgi:hypothetical protein